MPYGRQNQDWPGHEAPVSSNFAASAPRPQYLIQQYKYQGPGPRHFGLDALQSKIAFSLIP
jgi:hypothetical protein